MKAIVFEQCGDPADVLQVKEVPDPTPARRQVRVRMLASPINPSDLLYVRGEYGKPPKLPGVPGFEGVGVVEASGGGILGWRVRGRRVAVLNSEGGNWQEQVIIPARAAVPLPDELSDEQAATFFVNPASALAMIRGVLRVEQGRWLLQSAAGSALGRIVIRLGKRHQFRTINVVRREEQIAELKQLGADEVICCPEHEIPERVMGITQGKGARYALDAVGGATGSALVRSLGEHGRMIVYGLLSGEDVCFSPRTLMVGHKHVEGFWLSHWVRKQSVLRMLQLFRQINKLFREDVATSAVAQSYYIDQAQEAVRAAEQPARGGKVLLRFDQPT